MTDQTPVQVEDDRPVQNESMDDRIRRIVDQAPEFTDEGLRKLAMLLSPPPEPR